MKQPEKRGRGRPLPSDGEKQVRVNARLYPREIAYLTARYGSVHAGLRELVTKAMPSKGRK